MYLGKILLRICLVYIMDITNEDVQNRRGNGIIPPCAGVTPNALPEVQTPIEEENSQTGVSTRNALPKTRRRKPKPETIPHWYAIRCTYGRERRAYDFFQRKALKPFNRPLPTQNPQTVKQRLLSKAVFPTFFSHLVVTNN